jgi:hypothetical protein
MGILMALGRAWFFVSAAYPLSQSAFFGTLFVSYFGSLSASLFMKGPMKGPVTIKMPLVK